MRTLLAALITLCHILSVIATCTFLNPAPNTNISANVGDPVALSWVQDWGTSAMVSLTAYQLGPQGIWLSIILLTNETDPGQYQWNAGPIDTTLVSVPLHFQVKHTDFEASDSDSMNSGRVRLETNNLSTTTTISLEPSAASSTPTSNATQANSTPLSTLESDHRGLSTTTKVGLGVGLGVGIPFLILVLAVATYMLRLHFKGAEGETIVQESQNRWQETGRSKDRVTGLPGQTPSLQLEHDLLSETYRRHELP